MTTEIERGDLIRMHNPFYAGVVIDEAVHKLGPVWIIADPDGSRVVRDEDSAPDGDGIRLGTELADRVLAQGGAEILAALQAE